MKDIIYSKYNNYETKFIEFLFSLNKKWIPNRAILNHFHFIFKNKNTLNSTPKKIKKKDLSSGSSGDSPHSSSSNKVLRLKQEDIEIIKNTPLVNIADKIQEQIREEELFIDPETVIHAVRISYKFGADPKDQYRKKKSKTPGEIKRELELYEKIIENLNVDFGGNRGKNANQWAWPVLYIDKKHQIKSHFSIQMHVNGRFIIPLKREFNLGEFFQEFDKVFSFLTIDELLELYSILELKDGDGNFSPFVHLANKLDPDELAKMKLNKAKLKIRWLRYLDNIETKAYVDASRGIEFEIMGKNPQSMLLNKLISNAVIVADTLMDMANKTNRIEEDTIRLNVGQNVLYQQLQVVKRGIVATQCQAQINPTVVKSAIKDSIKPYSNKLNKFHSSFERGIDTLDNMNSNIRSIDQSINLFSEEITQVGEGVSSSIKNLYSTIEVETEEIKNNINTRIEEGNTDVINGLSSIIDSKHKESQVKLINIEGKIDNLSEKIEKMSKELSDIKEILKKEIKSRENIVNNISLILKKIGQLPGLTTTELYNMMKEELEVSKNTLYNYIKKLQDQELIISKRIKLKSGPGRPSRIITLSNKFKNLIKNLKK